jgi:hypothetical protein
MSHGRESVILKACIGVDRAVIGFFNAYAHREGNGVSKVAFLGGTAFGVGVQFLSCLHYLLSEGLNSLHFLLLLLTMALYLSNLLKFP